MIKKKLLWLVAAGIISLTTSFAWSGHSPSCTDYVTLQYSESYDDGYSIFCLETTDLVEGTDTDVVTIGECLFHFFEYGATEIVLDGRVYHVQDAIEMMQF